jgi:DNA-directed RNA polymerase specialized sigma24 family protein/CheY-like chemotaxis protein
MSKVFIVDDDPAIVAALQLMLEWNGFETATAHDLVTATERITREFFPLILADLRMREDDDGLQLIEAARQLSPRSRVATITGFADAATIERLRDRGATLVLQKPVEEGDLLAALGEMLASIESADASAPDDEVLYAQTERALRRIASGRYGFNREDAEELIQETWLLFLEKRAAIRAPGPWLSGTVANLCRREIERKVRERERTVEVFETGFTPSDDDVLSVRQGLRRLDERSRALCTMLAMEQRSYEEVSRAIDVPLGSVGPLYQRAKARLRAALN